MAETMAIRSSFIDESSYDRVTGDLVLTFSDGTQIVYHGVPPSLYTSFITSPSKGRFWHQRLKDWGDWEPA